MAVTEITKILFRRGKEADRQKLELQGGLAQGEPGFTSSEGWATALGTTKPDTNYKAAVLQSKDVVEHNSTIGGGDFFIGGSKGTDIYIGGSSAERHWSRYFVSLSGTGKNHGWNAAATADDVNYINGNLHVGAPGKGAYDDDPWTVKFYGVTGGASGTYNYQNLVTWHPSAGVFDIDSETALKVPVGTTNTRPESGISATAYTGSLTGLMRFNTTQKSFEGHNGTTWTGIGGAMSTDRRTYITFEDHTGNDIADCGGSTIGEVDTISFVTSCVSAGKFDVDGNLYVRNDIVAFYTSDESLKDNIYVIDNPLDKLQRIRGVEFDWNDSGPSWVDEENRHDIGLIAQDVERVAPEAVITRDNGTKAINYYKVIPLLVESIKQLNLRVEQLESTR